MENFDVNAFYEHYFNCLTTTVTEVNGLVRSQIQSHQNVVNANLQNRNIRQFNSNLAYSNTMGNRNQTPNYNPSRTGFVFSPLNTNTQRQPPQRRNNNYWNSYGFSFTIPTTTTTSNSQLLTNEQIDQVVETVSFEDISGTNHRTCPISLQPFIEGDNICRIVSCGHIFSRYNLNRWLTRSNTCPLCRTNLLDDYNNLQSNNQEDQSLNTNSNVTATTTTTTNTGTTTETHPINPSNPIQSIASVLSSQINNVLQNNGVQQSAEDLLLQLLDENFELNGGSNDNTGSDSYDSDL